jgi:hypothetical protein
MQEVYPSSISHCIKGWAISNVRRYDWAVPQPRRFSPASTPCLSELRISVPGPSTYHPAEFVSDHGQGSINLQNWSQGSSLVMGQSPIGTFRRFNS